MPPSRNLITGLRSRYEELVYINAIRGRGKRMPGLFLPRVIEPITRDSRERAEGEAFINRPTIDLYNIIKRNNKQTNKQFPAIIREKCGARPSVKDVIYILGHSTRNSSEKFRQSRRRLVGRRRQRQRPVTKSSFEAKILLWYLGARPWWHLIVISLLAG